MENQWREAETLKDQAVEEAIGSLRKKMRDEYAMEKERAIAEALSKARVRKCSLTLNVANSFLVFTEVLRRGRI